MAYNARPLLPPLIAIFAVSLGLAAVSVLASVILFFGGSYVVVAYGYVKQRKYIAARKVDALPEAIARDRRDH